MTRRTKKRLLILGLVTLLPAGVIACRLPAIGAAMILHPLHRPVIASPPPQCHEVTFNVGGISLQGWRGDGAGNFRGTLVYLHGVADNRASGAGVIKRFQKRGFDVVAYDSRAHGESGGDACTYGYFEKEDIERWIDEVLDPKPSK